jgi:1,4-alpha-glucan branching enzyme
MAPGTAEDGCPCFTATVLLDEAELGTRFRWGVRLDGPSGANLWGIPTEVNDMRSAERFREFELTAAPESRQQDFYFTYARRLGARKFFSDGAAPGLRLAAWAPNALGVEVVFGTPANGYIADDGDGIDPARPVLALTKGVDGILQSAVLPDFAAFEGVPYMYRIKNAQGDTVYRTDIFSRNQIGRGSIDPEGQHFKGTPATLDGSKSCSLVQSVDTVARDFDDPAGPRIADAEFWAHEFTPGMTVPSRIEDLIVYELHVNALGGSRPDPGTLKDAMDFLPYLLDLGVNAVELLPMAEFSGAFGWGYGDSHHFTIESSAGGRDEYKHFVRVPPPRPRRHPGRLLQPFRLQCRSRRVAVRLHGPRAEHLLLVRGPALRLQLSRGRLRRQRLYRLCPPVLGRSCPAPLREQRGRARGGIPRGWPARRPHAGDPPRQCSARGQPTRVRQRERLRPEDAS